MSKSKLKIALLGSGSMGSVHASAYKAIEKVEVAGVFSRDYEHAKAVARICDAKPVNDADALLDDPTIDAIDVCLPSANHAEFVIAALERGKHVFCETPFALHLRDAKAMIEAARQSKRILLVGLLLRSIAEYEHVHRAASSGQCGKMLSVTAYRLGSYLRPGDLGHKEHYTEPSTELMTFEFDFIQWLLGTPTRVSATAVQMESGISGEISAILDYDSGCSATVLASGLMPKAFSFSAGFRVLFEKCAFELKSVFEGDGPPKNTFLSFRDGGRPEVVAIQGHDPYEKELRHFVNCIRGKGDLALIDAQRALEALTLSIATQQSLRERQTIVVERIRDL